MSVHDKHAKYNQSAKGRARYARYRETHRDEIRLKDETRNQCRIFAGATYMGRAKTPEWAAVIHDHAAAMIAERAAKQREEYLNWNVEFDAALKQASDADVTAALGVYQREMEELVASVTGVAS